MTTKSTGQYMFGFLVASAMGALVGVLFAPRAGSDTRKMLATKVDLLARKCKPGRAATLAKVKQIFGHVTDDLERTYTQVSGEIKAQIKALSEAEDIEDSYQSVIKAAVTAAAKGQSWSKFQIDKLIAEFEAEHLSADDKVAA